MRRSIRFALGQLARRLCFASKQRAVGLPLNSDCLTGPPGLLATMKSEARSQSRTTISSSGRAVGVNRASPVCEREGETPRLALGTERSYRACLRTATARRLVP